MASVALENIVKRYGDFAAVDGLSLAVEDGEFLVLLGPSGCGKTTTLRILAGFIEASAGRVKIGARDVTAEPPYRRNIGLVFQNYALFPHLTVFENVAFGLRRRKVASAEIQRRVGEALELVRLGAHAQRLPRQLSGGQQQRVAIARALIIRPDVLLLDEPLSNLDAKLRLDVRQELRRLQRTLAMTTIMVTHDQDEAMSVGDRLVVMDKGRVQQVGSPAALYGAPSNRFVASFIGRANFLPGHADKAANRFVAASGLALASRHLGNGANMLMIRPERIEISASRPRGDNVFAATIEDATFLGAAQDIDLRLETGDRLQAVMPAQMANGGDWSPSRPVFIRIDPDAAVAIHDDAPSAASSSSETPAQE
jgi:putative spermidine/putrescine transport system ATP-binding protein